MALSQCTPDTPVCTILDQETYDRYGYWPQDLKPKSKKRIIVTCPGCGQPRAIRAVEYLPGKRCYACRILPNRLTHGQHNSPEYRTWQSMKNRCYYKKDRCFLDYGGRGITVCEEWRSSTGFPQFLADVGPRPSPQHSLDRIDNNGNYEPGNVRWATLEEQANNRRNNMLLTLGGQTKTLSQWSRDVGIGKGTIHRRLRHGWTVERALLQKPTKGKSCG